MNIKLASFSSYNNYFLKNGYNNKTIDFSETKHLSSLFSCIEEQVQYRFNGIEDLRFIISEEKDEDFLLGRKILISYNEKYKNFINIAYLNLTNEMCDFIINYDNYNSIPIFKDISIKLSEDNYIKTSKTLMTNIDNVYGIPDFVRKTSYGFTEFYSITAKVLDDKVKKMNYLIRIDSMLRKYLEYEIEMDPVNRYLCEFDYESIMIKLLSEGKYTWQ